MRDPKVCTCGCGKPTDVEYWHAWQAGRAFAWGDARPAWYEKWLRLRFRVTEAMWRLTHRKGSSQ